MTTLAVKYRPTTWDDVTEQKSVKIILQNQLANNAVKNAYLFCGGAGTGKTTCARIFANEINKGKGNPIEMDAASNSGVDDVRNIIQQAQTKSIDSDYKVFIIDECHSISNTGWQAFLKLLEEPPATSIFIFCTTNPERIPKTILSRVQQFNFSRISNNGIIARLKFILDNENFVLDK
jgi:DNA polymerase-3 subunit gamma/tau